MRNNTHAKAKSWQHPLAQLLLDQISEAATDYLQRAVTHRLTILAGTNTRMIMADKNTLPATITRPVVID